jgi:uncharacterized protein YdeI (YjbR/CyaY-like superfamily)
MTPIFFANQTQFRTWLKDHHDSDSELLVGFYKIDSGKPSMTWSESVDQALCFGWIDGVRKKIDDQRYSIRFTPRKPTSIWSAVNIAKVEKLIKQGLMQPAGLSAFQKRSKERSAVYSFEAEAKKLRADYETTFKSNPQAWEFFISQAPSYQKTIIHWIMTAKQESTQQSRLKKTIDASRLQKRLL